MKAVRVHEVGGPEVLRYEDVPVPEPGPADALVKIKASGVNFIDIYFRTGLYKAPLPLTLAVVGICTSSRRLPSAGLYKNGVCRLMV